MINLKNLKKIYCDFDGTITKTDSVNTFFEQYADKSWTYYEDLWIAGKISSKENAIKQVGLLPDIPADVLDNFIRSIEIDDYFLEFLGFLKGVNVELVILSDGFDMFIEKTLEKYNIKNVQFYANHLIYKDNKFSIDFPHHSLDCKIGAGMCKCNKITEQEFCYIGDGTSDLCVAQHANLLFAKKALKQHCEKKEIPYYSFSNFSDIKTVLENFK